MPGGRKNKTRGYVAEAEAIKIAQAAGLDCQRAWGSDGRALGWPSGVDVVTDGVPLQVKRTKQIPKTYRHLFEPPPGAVGVVVREDRAKPLVVLDYEWWCRSRKPCD